MKRSTHDSFFSLDSASKRRLLAIRREIHAAVRRADRNLERIRRAPATVNRLHPLALEEVRIEERVLVAALAGVRIKKSLLLKQQKGDKKLPDFEAEGLFLSMKEDRLQETLRSINQELEEWIKKLQLPF